MKPAGRVLEPGGLSRRAFLFLPLLASPLLARAVESLSFDTLYKAVGVLGIKYSDRALALRGQVVRLRGYMAPPLKPESRFFVLTREPVAVCPFCASDAEWPVDIVVVYLKGTLAPVDFSQRIEVDGRLEIGSSIDRETGFVSQVRIVDAEVRKP
jgi:hypothetical protein